MGSPRLDRRAECVAQRRCDAALERVAGQLLHFPLNRLERRAFSLTNLDGEQLEEVTVAVGCRGAGSFGAIQQSVGDVIANGPSARCCARGCVGWPNANGVHKSGDVRSESTRIPGGVTRVSAK